jgi:hypothetical protein
MERYQELLWGNFFHLFDKCIRGFSKIGLTYVEKVLGLYVSIVLLMFFMFIFGLNLWFEFY